MVHSRILALACALLCVAVLCVPAFAAEVESGSSYCFGAGDFSGDREVSGIWLTELPEGYAAVKLGDRTLHAGDVLTAQQISQMTLWPRDTEEDRLLEVGYLPIYPDGTAEPAVLTMSLRGKEDKPPIAEDSTLETYKNLPNTGKLKASDPENKALTYTVTRQPRRGVVTIAEDGSFTYTPKKNKVGIDSFVYTATDPAGKTSREATVTVTILKPTVGETLDRTACFGPEKLVTKGEFVTMLVKTLDLPLEQEASYTGYEDEIPLWLQPYLAAAVRSGLTEGLEQEVFEADSPVTALEMDTLLNNALTRETGSFDSPEQPVTRAQAACALYDAANQLKTELWKEIG